MKIILDLDHCLIYSSYSEICDLECMGKKGYLYLYHRPGLNDFLKLISKIRKVEILFYTSSKSAYAKWVLKSFNLSIKYQLYTRKYAKRKITQFGEVFLKSIAFISQETSTKNFVIDDRPELWDENGIEMISIDPWHGEIDDDQLSHTSVQLLKKITLLNTQSILKYNAF